ncbi:hypothetical protein QJ048_09320 [Pinibacter sp. MAH-24]|uniref:Uncharacterized protein n=1 Tax=Pinibacter soli TaxID=3044211 RepID=A0ABT6RBM6_9BACT|nr:hypothetical protein [Pinibacter soli]
MVDNIEGARYFKTITGEIINAETNEQMMLPTKELPPVKKEYLKHDFVDRKEMERREDEVIEAYLKQFQ